MMSGRVDVDELRDKVKGMYKAVAEEPHGTFHFEMGRALAERLGYPAGEARSDPGGGDRVVRRRRIPPRPCTARCRANRSWTSGAARGRTAFLAGRHAGPTGEVIGVDMTEEQLAKARRLGERDGHTTVRFVQGYLEETPVEDGWADVVVSNGVINLCDDKKTVFGEIARMLAPGGRMAISDIVTERRAHRGNRV